MSTPWQTVRVFISSTFRDMQAERDHLVRFVFPKVREELLKWRVHLEDVDLRWGVTTDQDAFDLCMKEIDLCHPRFICMLGWRYGWVPPPEAIVTDDFVKVLAGRFGIAIRILEQAAERLHQRGPEPVAADDEAEPAVAVEIARADRDAAAVGLRADLEVDGCDGRRRRNRGDEGGQIPLGRRAVTKALAEQAQAVRAQLAALGAPATATACKGARADRVEDLLETLAPLGQARPLPDGTFVAQ
jgi:hypothetical protein